MNDDTKQNTNQKDSDVIASEAKQSSSDINPDEIAAPPAADRNDEVPETQNLPVEEAGLIEAPKEDENVITSEQSERSNLDSEENKDSDASLGMTENEEPKTETKPEESDITDESTDPSATPQDDTTQPEPAAEKPSNDNPNARWYVVHTYSGHENKVAATLKQRIESQHLQDKILDVLVPMQDKIEIKGGKRLEVKEKIFPGYILVKMVLDDNTWLAVRTTQGVTSFVGIGNKPTPIPEAEVQTIVRFTQVQAPTFKQIFAVDDTIKIVDGPFSEFIGKVDSVDEEKGKVRVLVSIFGRETPVELDFLQVQKI